MSSVNERRTGLFARSTTRSLIEALRLLADEGQHALTEDERTTKRWIIEVLEKRLPAASQEVGRIFEEVSAREVATGENIHVDYAAELLRAIEKTGLR